jgi:DNA-binding transcriptional MerR regulator
MNPNLAVPTLLMGSDVVWIDAATPAPGADDDLLSIAQIAKKFSVTQRTLRFYESKGLLRPARKGRSRVYGHNDQQDLALVLKGRKLGFTIGEILQMIDVESGRASPQTLKMTRKKCLEQIDHLERRMQETMDALAELRRIHTTLCRP